MEKSKLIKLESQKISIINTINNLEDYMVILKNYNIKFRDNLSKNEFMKNRITLKMYINNLKIEEIKNEIEFFNNTLDDYNKWIKKNSNNYNNK